MSRGIKVAHQNDGSQPPNGQPTSEGKRAIDLTARQAMTQRERLAAMAPKSAPKPGMAQDMAPPAAIGSPSRPAAPLAGTAKPAASPSAPKAAPGQADLPPRSSAPTPITRTTRSLPPQAGAARQIWDIEEQPTTRPLGKKDAEPLMLRTPAPSTPKSDAPAQRPISPKAKTRILGFHAQNVTKDVFDQSGAAKAAEDRFPAGWIVVVDGPGRGASFIVSTSVSTIGRGEDQAISLDFGDTSISRQNHASVAYDDEQNKFFIGHGGKSNVVRRNGTPVLATEELENGDLIRIGKTTLRFVALCGAEFSWRDSEAEKGFDGGAHDGDA